MQALRSRLNSAIKTDDYKNLKVYICSWNVNGISPDFDLSTLLKFSNNSPDICVFGFQEVNSKPWQRIVDYFYYDPWTSQLTQLLSKLGYIRINSTRLVGILLNVFVKREHVGHIRYSMEDWIRLGFFGLWGNKGANILTLNIGGMNLCFINSHLSAHEYQSKKREQEYSAILSTQKFSTVYYQETMVLKEDYQFIFGDLNFRIEGLSIDNVKELILKKEFEKLLEYDQLRRCIKNKELFSNFHEKAINFAPTYKFDKNTHTYDTSTKKRVPSWCDRILYKQDTKEKTLTECEQLVYDSITELDQSDHKPVYSLFQIRIKNFDDIESGIVFSQIFFNGKDIEISYEINANCVTHRSDWIGVYKTDFKSTEDCITYIYPERIIDFENKKFKKDLDRTNIDLKAFKKIVILKGYYVGSGIYVVGYYSSVSKQLINLSSQFEVKLT